MQVFIGIMLAAAVAFASAQVSAGAVYDRKDCIARRNELTKDFVTPPDIEKAETQLGSVIDLIKFVELDLNDKDNAAARYIVAVERPIDCKSVFSLYDEVACEADGCMNIGLLDELYKSNYGKFMRAVYVCDLTNKPTINGV